PDPEISPSAGDGPAGDTLMRSGVRADGRDQRGEEHVVTVSRMSQSVQSSWLATYLNRMHGTSQLRKRPHPYTTVHTWVTALIGITAVAAPTLQLGLSGSANLFLIGSFGATAVLLYALPHSELAQPRHVIGGHFL